MQSPTPAPVFVPPGAGRRRAPQNIATRVTVPALVGGWYLAKAIAALAFLFGGAVGAFYIIDSLKSPARLPDDFLGSLVAAFSGGLLIPAYALAALAALYNVAWIIVPLVALCQGHGKGALVYLVGSPVVISAGIVLGAAAGAGAAKLFFLL